MGFSKQRFDFPCKTAIEQLKNIDQNQPSASWRKLTLCAQISPKSQATECKFARRLR